MNAFELQGQYGENIVQNYYIENGFTVVKNPDDYGRWDLFVYNKNEAYTIQVKTMVRYIIKNYFGICAGPSGRAFETLRTCDKLILVVRNPDNPNIGKDKEFGGKVLEVLNHEKFTIQNNNYIIPSRWSNFKLLTELTPQQIIEVDSFKTGANYGRKTRY